MMPEQGDTQLGTFAAPKGMTEAEARKWTQKVADAMAAAYRSANNLTEPDDEH